MAWAIASCVRSSIRRADSPGLTLRCDMAKLRCRCGHVISDVVFPNELEGELLSAKSKERLFDFIDAALADMLRHLRDDDIAGWRNKHVRPEYPESESPEALAQLFQDVVHGRYCDLTLDVYQCEACRRLHVQTGVGENRFASFAADHPEHAPHVLGLNDEAAEA